MRVTSTYLVRVLLQTSKVGPEVAKKNETSAIQ